MRLKKRKIKVIKCGCSKTKKNRLQRAVAKSQKPKPKPKIDEKTYLLSRKHEKKSNIATNKLKRNDQSSSSLEESSV